ncbi:fluoride efflux transporter FluC [Ornithinimicrobium cryptoxanthini]|uniref:fluoride efflux transporter FluC n=1 Tax=Ornithinimicrobium cryptoxanthini TaxID=2934161 RepID=UPI002117E0F6|nr:CrcB family protein [Ornithinimicrobium cryptoxanthini]
MRLTPLLVVVVALGGALGTTGRYAAAHLIPSAQDIPWATLAVNLVGAFLLGLLLETLSRTGAETPRRQLARLGLGTGLLGGFTTYSTLALEVLELWSDGQPARAVGYGAGSVSAGLLVALAGIVLAHRLGGQRAGGGARHD